MTGLALKSPYRAATLVQPDSWQWLYDARERGLVPRSRVVRIAVVGELWGKDVLRVPENLGPREIDWSLVAGLDAVAIIDGNVAARRVQELCFELQRAGAESLRLFDLMARRNIATLRVGHEQVRGDAT